LSGQFFQRSLFADVDAILGAIKCKHMLDLALLTNNQNGRNFYERHLATLLWVSPRVVELRTWLPCRFISAFIYFPCALHLLHFANYVSYMDYATYVLSHVLTWSRPWNDPLRPASRPWMAPPLLLCGIKLK